MTKQAGPHDSCGIASPHKHCPTCDLLLAYEVDGRMVPSIVANQHIPHERT